MKWYKAIACDNTKKKPMVCGFDNLNENGFEEDDFLIGKPIVNWKDNIIFQAKTEKHNGDPDDVLQNKQMLPIFSDKLICELKKMEIESIQYLPITVLRPDYSIINGYSIVNILDFIEAFDYEKSTYSRFDQNFPNPNVRGEIAGIVKFVLKHDKLCGKDIIRLREYNRAFFVSERIRKIFTVNKFTGYSFKEVELSHDHPDSGGAEDSPSVAP
jgi:hypothetical protein